MTKPKTVRTRTINPLRIQFKGRRWPVLRDIREGKWTLEEVIRRNKVSQAAFTSWLADEEFFAAFVAIQKQINRRVTVRQFVDSAAELNARPNAPTTTARKLLLPEKNPAMNPDEESVSLLEELERLRADPTPDDPNDYPLLAPPGSGE